MKLIPDWRKAWRLVTVQIGCAAPEESRLESRTEVRSTTQPKLDKQYLPGIVGLAVIIGRVIAQPKTHAYKQESMLNEGQEP